MQFEYIVSFFRMKLNGILKINEDGSKVFHFTSSTENILWTRREERNKWDKLLGVKLPFLHNEYH